MSKNSTNISMNDKYIPQEDRADDYYIVDDNSTALGREQWRVEVYRYAIPLLLALFGLSLAANIYVLIALRWLRKRLSLNLLFTISLTVADAWVSFVVGLGVLVNSYLVVVHEIRVFGDEYSTCFGLLFEAIRVGAMVTTIFHLLALTVYHYLGIVQPLRYLSLLTRKGAIAVILVLWISPPATLLAVFSVVGDQAFRSEHCANVYFTQTIGYRMPIAATILGPLLVIALLYTRMVVVIMQTRRKRTEVLGMFFGSTKESRRTEFRKLKAVSTTSLVVGTYVVGWLPIVTAFVVFCGDCAYQQENFAALTTWASLVGHLLLSLKCLFNPLIYAVRNSEVRTALRSMHAQCFHFSTTLSRRASFVGRNSISYSDGTSAQNDLMGPHSLLRYLSLRLLRRTSLIMESRSQSPASAFWSSPANFTRRLSHAGLSCPGLATCGAHKATSVNSLLLSGQNTHELYSTINRSIQAMCVRRPSLSQSLVSIADNPARRSLIIHDPQRCYNPGSSPKCCKGLEKPALSSSSNLSSPTSIQRSGDSPIRRSRRLDKSITGPSDSIPM